MREMGKLDLCAYSHWLLAKQMSDDKGERKITEENECNPTQNVGEDTSQLSVGKHIPQEQQSQSIYHITMKLYVCVCVVHVCA